MKQAMRKQRVIVPALKAIDGGLKRRELRRAKYREKQESRRLRRIEKIKGLNAILKDPKVGLTPLEERVLRTKFGIPEDENGTLGNGNTLNLGCEPLERRAVEEVARKKQNR